MDIIAQRLRNQGLRASSWKSPHDVVKALGAVQAQDYPAAQWAIGLRLPGSSSADITRAMVEGSIIRTHVLRPTWHFVAPEDIRWMLAVTAPRIKSTLASYLRTVSLDAVTLAQAETVLRKVMKGKHCTRAELRAALEKAGITTKGLRFGFILLHAELNALICSGAPQGKHQTYALLDERAPLSKAITPKDPVLELVTRYFTSHGPATLHDFLWWAQVKVADVRKALAASSLKSVDIEGKTYWFSQLHAEKTSESFYLLPNYDEYISYKDRSHYFEKAIDRNELINHFIVRSGKIIGAWKHRSGKEVETKLFVSLSSSEKQRMQQELGRYKKFRLDTAVKSS